MLLLFNIRQFSREILCLVLSVLCYTPVYGVFTDIRTERFSPNTLGRFLNIFFFILFYMHILMNHYYLENKFYALLKEYFST